MIKPFENDKLRYLFICVFLAIELALSICLQLAVLGLSSILSYLSITLCFLFAFCFFKRDKDYLFTLLAILFTLIADVFLVLCSPQKQLAGMIAFLFTQTFYAIKLLFAKQRNLTKIIFTAIRVFASCIMALVAKFVLKNNCDALAIVSVVYYANLLLNVIHAFICRKWLFAFGLILFALCDICIGLQIMANGYLPIPSDSILIKILYPGFNLPWVFYLPSQVAIALSVAFPKPYKKTKNS